MIDPRKYKYTVVVVAEDKTQYDITNLVENLQWIEEEEQLAARILFTSRSDTGRTDLKKKLYNITRPGCYVGILYSYNGGQNREAVRGRIVEWNPSAVASGERFKVKAYDALYDLQESQDNIYFSAGAKTKSVLQQIFKNWGIPMGTYTGPNVSHGKLVYKSEKLGTAVFKILKDAKSRGGVEAVPRAVKDKVEILKYGSNSTIYTFRQGEQVSEVSHKISTVGMVTRVKIIGRANDNGSSPVISTVNGKTEYGIRQRILTKGDKDKLSEVKKEAQEELDENGSPKHEITLKVPDIPDLRKGDEVFVKALTVSDGYYYVIGVTHDCDKGMMTLNLKKSTSKTTSSIAYEAGDIVSFTGSKYYVSSSSGSKAVAVKGRGKAKIMNIVSGAAHPYHLITENWKNCTVHGWVDEGTFTEEK